MFSSPYLDWAIERVALNAKVVGGPHGDKDKMVAVSSESRIILWSIQDGGSGNEIGERQECINKKGRNGKNIFTTKMTQIAIQLLLI